MTDSGIVIRIEFRKKAENAQNFMRRYSHKCQRAHILFVREAGARSGKQRLLFKAADINKEM
jgi:hypothetical protein